MFWPHAFTSTQSCSIIQIMCRCKDDKATTITCHVMWLVRVVLFKDCPGSLIVIFTLIAAWKISNIGFITMHGLNEGHIAPLPLKKKAMFCTNDPFSSTFMNWWLWCYYWFRRGFSPKSLQPEKKTLLYRLWNLQQGHHPWKLHEGFSLFMVSKSSAQHVAWEIFSPSRFE